MVSSEQPHGVIPILREKRMIYVWRSSVAVRKRKKIKINSERKIFKECKLNSNQNLAIRDKLKRTIKRESRGASQVVILLIPNRIDVFII